MFETVVCKSCWLWARRDRYAIVLPSISEVIRKETKVAERRRSQPKCCEQTTRTEERGVFSGLDWNSVRVYGRGFVSRAGVLHSKMSSLDYLDLCRLCLVKDRVSVPIFEGEGDVRQIFLKIAACLPVKVSQLRHRFDNGDPPFCAFS